MDAAPTQSLPIVRPLPQGMLRLYRVDPKVNSYKIDDPSCIEPLTS